MMIGRVAHEKIDVCADPTGNPPNQTLCIRIEVMAFDLRNTELILRGGIVQTLLLPGEGLALG